MIGGGEVELWTGEQLEHREVARAGDYIYIPAGVPYVAVNRTNTPPGHPYRTEAECITENGG